jgi:hypothetical protein
MKKISNKIPTNIAISNTKNIVRNGILIHSDVLNVNSLIQYESFLYSAKSLLVILDSCTPEESGISVFLFELLDPLFDWFLKYEFCEIRKEEFKYLFLI